LKGVMGFERETIRDHTYVLPGVQALANFLNHFHTYGR
jgi:hypothetical protein